LPSNRKPLAKVEGRRRLRLSGFTIVWRGTPGVDDWVAYIAKPSRRSSSSSTERLSGG